MNLNLTLTAFVELDLHINLSVSGIFIATTTYGVNYIRKPRGQYTLIIDHQNAIGSRSGRKVVDGSIAEIVGGCLPRKSDKIVDLRAGSQQISVWCWG